MKSIQFEIEQIVKVALPDLCDITARHDYLEITQEDIALLCEIHLELELQKHVLSHEFYEHLRLSGLNSVFLRQLELL